HRGSVTEEYLRAMQVAWTADGPASYAGRYVRFRDVGARPRPARSPHLPIWVGGKGERALRRAARLGDGYLAIASDPQTLSAETARLRELAQQAARAPEELSVALIDGIVLGPEPLAPEGASLGGTPEQVLDGLRLFAAAGLQHLIAGISRAGDASFDAAVQALETVAATILPEARKM
ncbi:MAG: LLM class flavin-dependent oxidoreductase, partial [Planctomycetota bacterium]